MAVHRKRGRRGETGRGNILSATRCADCGKVAYPSRGVAKTAMRKRHPSEVAVLNVYRCVQGQYWWHIGHREAGFNTREAAS